MYGNARKTSRSPMYMVEGMMGHDSKGFIKCVQQLYKENKDKYPSVKRPTSLKACITFVNKMGLKVYTKEANSNWFRI